MGGGWVEGPLGGGVTTPETPPVGAPLDPRSGTLWNIRRSTKHPESLRTTRDKEIQRTTRDKEIQSRSRLLRGTP